MKKYVYIALSFLSFSVSATKFEIQNMSNSTLNGFLIPSNQGFTLKSKKQETFDRKNVSGFKVGLSDDATTFISYQFKDTDNKDLKFVIEVVPGKGGKKMLRVLTQHMPSQK